ncbi:MAG: hypothetical protein QXQ14_00170 [Candidatus Aenigmatarchaeota archaeon]
MRKDEALNVAKIFKVLKEARGWIWIREIARRANLNHKTVSRLLSKYFLPFVEIQQLPFRLKLVKLREDIDFKKFMNYWKIKKLQEII